MYWPVAQIIWISLLASHQGILFTSILSTINTAESIRVWVAPYVSLFEGLQLNYWIVGRHELVPHHHDQVASRLRKSIYGRFSRWHFNAVRQGKRRRGFPSWRWLKTFVWTSGKQQVQRKEHVRYSAVYSPALETDFVRFIISKPPPKTSFKCNPVSHWKLSNQSITGRVASCLSN